MAEPRRPPTEPPPEPQAAGALATVAAAGAATGTPPPPPVVPTAAAIASATKPVLAGLKRLFADRNRLLDEDILLLLRQEYPDFTRKVMQEIVNEEVRLEGIFQRRARERVARDMRTALAVADAQKRRDAVQAILNREKRYVQLREASLARRVTGRADMVRVKLASPRGAYWKLSPHVSKHTIDCVAMGEKWWPWEVLDKLNPANRHHGCACTLIGEAEAVALGLITPDLIPNDPSDAIARARRYAQDVPEIRVALEEARAVPDANPDMNRALSALIGHPVDDLLRWPKGWEFGGRYRPRRGGSAGRRVVRGNIPHAPEPPTVSRGERRGRHVPIRGRIRFVPEQEDWSEEVDGDRFDSPIGGTNVYRNGELVSEPGRRGRHPDVRRAARARNPSSPPTVLTELPAEVEHQKALKREPLAQRVGERAAALGPEAPVEVGDGSEVQFALYNAGFIPFGTEQHYINPDTGAVLYLKLDDGGVVTSVEWHPEGIPEAPATHLDRAPESWGEFQADMKGWSDDLAARFGASEITKEVIADPEIEDHGGKHSWDGKARIGRRVPSSIDEAALKRASGEELSHEEHERLWFSYRVVAHELSHGVNPMDPRDFNNPDGGLSLIANIEEALTEEASTVLAVERMRAHGQTDTLAWLRQQQNVAPSTRGNYGEQRIMLRVALEEARIPPEQYEDAILQLKFQVDPAQRVPLLVQMAADAQGISPEQAAEVINEGIANALASEEPFTPLLAADLTDVEVPQTEGVSIGDPVSFDGEHGVVIDDWHTGDAVIVNTDAGDMSVVPKSMLRRGPRQIIVGGERLGVGDEIEYGRLDGGVSQARITDVRKVGDMWEVEAITLNDSAKPGQIVLLSPDRVTSFGRPVEDEFVPSAPLHPLPVGVWGKFQKGIAGDRFPRKASPVAEPQSTKGLLSDLPLTDAEMDALTDDVMRAVEAHGIGHEYLETWTKDGKTYRMHGGDTEAGWRSYLEENTEQYALQGVREAVDYNAKLPLFSEVEAKWGAQAVIPHRGEHFLYPSFFEAPDGKNLGGVTYVYQSAIALSPNVSDEGPEPGMDSSAHLGIAAVVRHEYAHLLWSKLSYEDQAAFYKLLPKMYADTEMAAEGMALPPDDEALQRDLTRYPPYTPHATEEAFAELFAIITHPDYDPDDGEWALWVRQAGDWMTDRLQAGPGVRAGEPASEGLRQHLEQMVALREHHSGTKAPDEWTYKSPEDFFLREGREYDVPDELLPAEHSRWEGEKKMCFQNAATMALFDKEERFTYVEGMATPGSIPIPLAHAWVVDKDGTVIDPTWDDAKGYLGVPVPTGLLRKWILTSQHWGLFQDWEHGHPELHFPWSDILESGEPPPTVRVGEPESLPAGYSLERRPDGYFDVDGDWTTRYGPGGRDYMHDPAHEAKAEVRAVFRGGKPVASLTWQDEGHRIMVGTAYTEPEHRKKGLFFALTEELREAGKPVDAYAWMNQELRQSVRAWQRSNGPISSPDPEELTKNEVERAVAELGRELDAYEVERIEAQIPALVGEPESPATLSGVPDVPESELWRMKKTEAVPKEVWDKVVAHVRAGQEAGIPGAYEDSDWEYLRERERAWERSIESAIERGLLTEEEAREKGYYGTSRYPYETLPPRLYHVTTAREAVRESGVLRGRAEGDEMGLGGGADDTVSFTGDRAKAEEIADAMLLAGRVVRGEVSIEELIEIARRGDGADAPWLAETMEFFDHEWRDGDPLPEKLQRALMEPGRDTTRATRVLPKSAEWWREQGGEPDPDSKMGGDNYMAGFMPVTDEAVQEARLAFLKSWLFWRDAKKGGLDPLFFTVPASAIALMDEDTVGIVEAAPKEPGYRGQWVDGPLDEWRVINGEHTPIQRITTPAPTALPRVSVPASPGLLQRALRGPEIEMTRPDLPLMHGVSMEAFEHGGLLLVPDKEDPRSGMQQFAIRTAGGEDAGLVRYTVRGDAAQLDNFFLQAEHRRSGFGKAFMDEWYRLLRQNGIGRVEMNAMGDGSLVWAKMGYGFRGSPRHITRDILDDAEQRGLLDDPHVDADAVRARFAEGFNSPQEIILIGIDNPWTVYVDGKPEKMWTGKLLMLDNAWPGELILA